MSKQGAVKGAHQSHAGLLPKACGVLCLDNFRTAVLSELTISDYERCQTSVSAWGQFGAYLQSLGYYCFG